MPKSQDAQTELVGLELETIHRVVVLDHATREVAVALDERAHAVRDHLLDVRPHEQQLFA